VGVAVLRCGKPLEQLTNEQVDKIVKNIEEEKET